VVPKSSGEFLLLRRSPEAARGLHVPSAVMAPLNAGLNVGFYFRVFMFFFFLMCSQFASVMLKCYWTICWLRCCNAPPFTKRRK